MTRIAVVDNHGQFTHLEGRALRDIDVEHEIVDNETSVAELEDYDPDGLVLSGGPSIDRIGNCPAFLEMDLPVLGICLGHQVIAREFGGTVESGDYGGFADVDIDILEPEGLFSGFPETISTWASHGDEVTALPDGFVRTAESDICAIEAMRHDAEPIFGVQWHPEVHHTELGLELFENFVGIVEDR
jgi:GMP synthase (glutamine-hydrolysing)